MPTAPTIPGYGTGFVSLGDYLNGNQQALSSEFSNLTGEAKGLSGVAGAPLPAGQTYGQPLQGVAAGNLAAQVGSESGLAGRDAQTAGQGGGAFDAALQWAQNGPALQNLSQYLQTQAAPPPQPSGVSYPVQPGQDQPPQNPTPSGTHGSAPVAPPTRDPWSK